MRKLFTLNIIMFIMAVATIGQTTYIVHTKNGLKYSVHQDSLLATLTGDIPDGLSPDEAFEAYKNPGKPVVYDSNSKALYSKYGFTKITIIENKSIVYYDGKLIPQIPRTITESEKFAWDNLIILIVLFIVCIILTTFFWEKEYWIGEDSYFTSYVIAIIGCLMWISFCFRSPGSDLKTTIFICSIVPIFSFFVGYILRRCMNKKIVF